MKQATLITGSGLQPLLKLKAMQYARRARTERELIASRDDDLADTFFARREAEASDNELPAFIREAVVIKDLEDV